MKTVIKSVIAVAALGLFVGTAGASDIKNSKIETNVKAEKINQATGGLGNTNTVQAGNVGSDKTKIKNSKVTTNVKVKDVNQASGGLGNKNEVKLGNVQ